MTRGLPPTDGERIEQIAAQVVSGRLLRRLLWGGIVVAIFSAMTPLWTNGDPTNRFLGFALVATGGAVVWLLTEPAAPGGKRVREIERLLQGGVPLPVGPLLEILDGLPAHPLRNRIRHAVADALERRVERLDDDALGRLARCARAAVDDVGMVAGAAEFVAAALVTLSEHGAPAALRLGKAADGAGDPRLRALSEECRRIVSVSDARGAG